MQPTTKPIIKSENKFDEIIATDTEGLQTVLSCGRQTAVKIGNEAEARIQIGKRVLWLLPRIKAYLETVAK